MLQVIGCIFAPDLNHVRPQGVHRDSLLSFSSIGPAKLDIIRRCAPFLSAQHLQSNYMYCNRIIHIIYVVLYKMCEYQVGAVVG
jgi:hypothetical protein